MNKRKLKDYFIKVWGRKKQGNKAENPGSCHQEGHVEEEKRKACLLRLCLITTKKNLQIKKSILAYGSRGIRIHHDVEA